MVILFSNYWDGLTRRIDADGLERICDDPKNRSPDKQNRIYIPFRDQFAFDYFTQVALDREHLNLDVIRLPEILTPTFVKSLNTTPGILSLGLRESVVDEEKVIKGTPFVGMYPLTQSLAADSTKCTAGTHILKS